MHRRHIYTLLTLVLLINLGLTTCGKDNSSSPANGTLTNNPTTIPIPTILPITTPSPTPTPTSIPTLVPTPTPILLTPPSASDYQSPAMASAAPFVIQRSPGRGEELGLDRPIELVFDRPMNRTSVAEVLVVSVSADSGEMVEGRLEWADDRTMRFKPDGLARDTRYHVLLGQEARSQEGVPLDGDYGFRFNTVGLLEVTQTIPADGSTDLELNETIMVMFNRPVVPLTTISLSSVDLPHPLRFAPPIEGTGEWLNTSIYVFTPSEPLAYGTAYTARVEAGLSDVTGGLLVEDHVWRFSTLPPKVVSVSPGENQEMVPPPGTTVVVQFNQDVDANSATSVFRLFLQDDQDVQGKLKIQGDTLIFTPTATLDFGTTYQVEISASVRSASGSERMREPFRSSFKTVPLPCIVSTYPSDGDQDADHNTNFVIEFNAPVDPETIMPNLEMTPPISPDEVQTSFRGRTFTLNFGAQPNTDYEVRIGLNIADPYDNKTGQSLTVRFRTGSPPVPPTPEPLRPAVSLRVPGHINTYDADQPIRLTVIHRNTDQLDLSLHQLGPDQFLRRESGDRVREWSVDVPFENENQTTSIDLVRTWGRQLSPGIYRVQVGAPGIERDHYPSHILIVSEINLTLKVTFDETLVWATNLASGMPVRNLKLTALDAEGQDVGSAVTDDDGLARFELPDRGSYGSLYVSAESPFVLASEGWNYGIRGEDFGLGVDYQRADYRAHTYTDREIYRPNQTVYFRGIVRTEDDVQYRLPNFNQVHVQISDAAGQVLLDGGLALDAYGAFHGGVTLGEGASLGTYHIKIRTTDGSARLDAGTSFQVAEYRPPEFDVLVTPDEAEIARNKSTYVTVDASYFFGAPVVNAQVDWNVMSGSDAFQPVQFSRYSFGGRNSPWVCWWEELVWSPQPVVHSGSGQTDQDGRLIIELPSDLVSEGGKRLTVEATAYGRDGQVISGRGQIVVHQGEFYIGLLSQRYVGRVGEEMTVDVVTVDWDGERWPNQKLEYQVYGSEEDPVAEGTLTTDANAGGTVRFTPPQGGSYRVVVSGRGPRERLVRSSVFVWVSGREHVSWRRENDDRFILISDKTSYAPGETAEILIPSPFEGDQWAWITVERGGVLYQEVLELESNSYVYRLPITAGYAPNVYVSAVIVQGREPNGETANFKVGYVLLDVSVEQQELTLTLTPSTDKVEPGETVSFEIRASDYAGEPVAAEFSLDLVDKAILTLRPRTPDAVVNAFYGRRGLGVRTASGLSVLFNRLVQEEPDQAVQVQPAEAEVVLEAEVGTARSAPAASPPGVQARDEFADTAYWRADVITGQDGRAVVEITLPDNLTTWVMRGVGTTVETQVGEVTAEIVATRPLIVRPVTPRFFVVGDHVQLAANVSNNADHALDVIVDLDAVGLALDGSAEQRIEIPAGAEGKVTWWVTVQDVPNVDLVFTAVSSDGAHGDAARPRMSTGPGGTIEVFRYTAPEIVGTGGQIVGPGGDSHTEAIVMPLKYDDRRGELNIQLDPSLAAGMRDGLNYLEHFEYDCADHTVNRFLPNVLTYRALNDLGLTNPELEHRLPGLVQKGLMRLYPRQNDDGGWGWCHANRSNPHLTGYVVFALAKANEAGFEVRQGAIQRGIGYLQGRLVTDRELLETHEVNLQAWILYMMAEVGERDRIDESVNTLYQNHEKLGNYSRAYLAMALSLLDPGDERINTLLSDLTNDVIVSATGAHWEEPFYDRRAMNTDTRSTAIILDALARLDPDNALIPNVVRWLMVARQESVWETTQETVWAIIALTDWMVVTGELEGRYDYGISLNGSLLHDGQVTPETIDQSIKLRMDVVGLLADAYNYLTISREDGPGRLYYTAHLKVYLPVEEIEPLNRGIIVHRQYICTDDGTVRPCTRAQVGDIVQVKLTIVAPHDLYYLVVEDMLPAGTEAVDASLDTTDSLARYPALQSQGWWHWYSRKELHDEKVVLFADYVRAGTYEHTYAFRAVLPGEYQVIPTFANEAYFPEVFGLGKGELFTILE